MTQRAIAICNCHGATMDFHIYTTLREACKKSGVEEDPAAFYRLAFNDAFQMGSGQFYGQLQNEQVWEQAHRPYYNVWPSIVAMLTRLNLDLDSSLIQLPLPALCIRFPKQNTPLTFRWKAEEVQIRSMLMGTINDGKGLSLRRPTGNHHRTTDSVEDATMHEDTAIWSRKGATLSDKSARQEFGLTQDEIYAAFRSGKLQFREGNMHGNPWFRLLRHEVEALVKAKSGKDHLHKKKLQKELSDLNKEARKL